MIESIQLKKKIGIFCSCLCIRSLNVSSKFKSIDWSYLESSAVFSSFVWPLPLSTKTNQALILAFTVCFHFISTHLLRMFESLRSSFWSFWFGCDWATLSKQFTKSLDALLLLLPFKWQVMLFGLVAPATLVTLPLPLLLLAFFRALLFVACSICEISSTCSLFNGDVLAIFLIWSFPNGDGISCFKTVNADESDRNESLQFKQSIQLILMKIDQNREKKLC